MKNYAIKFRVVLFKDGYWYTMPLGDGYDDKFSELTADSLEDAVLGAYNWSIKNPNLAYGVCNDFSNHKDAEIALKNQHAIVINGQIFYKDV